MNRTKKFNEIKKVLSENSKISLNDIILAEGDSLALLKLFPDKSVSLILTDPPYHSTKKKNIQGDTSFKQDKEYLDWMAQYIKEWRRILQPNGSIFCFCAPEMSARLEVIFSQKFNILSQVVWTKPNEPGFDGWKQKMKKEALRQWYPHTERIIFAEPSHNGNLHKSYFGNLLRKWRQQSGLSGHKLTDLVGAFGKVNHGGAVSNWEAGRNIPSRLQYKKICNALIETGKIKSLPEYEDAIRPFKVDATKEFTDVWNFPSVRPFKDKHPAEKPASLLEHAISATSYEGDIVLDCFSGSGSTGIAARKLGRLAVLIDLDPLWIKNSALRIVSTSDIKELEKEESSRQLLKKFNQQSSLF